MGGQGVTIGWPEILAIVSALLGIGIWVGRISANQGHLKEAADQDRALLKEFMQEIREDFKTLLGRTFAPTAIGTSPAQLTEFGEEIADAIGAIAWAIEEAKSVIADDDLRELQPFQVEAFCRNFVKVESAKAGVVQEKIQQAMYVFGIEQDRAFPVLSIPLREALLARKEVL